MYNSINSIINYVSICYIAISRRESADIGSCLSWCETERSITRITNQTSQTYQCENYQKQLMSQVNISLLLTTDY